MPTPHQITVWNDAFSSIERVADYQRLQTHCQSINNQISRLTESAEKHVAPRNPRLDALQQQEKYRLSMLKKQLARLHKKMEILESQIKEDIKTQVINP